jgi:enolase
MKIDKINARQILDSRGNWTVECDVTLSDGSFGRGAVPSGASTGAHEALEIPAKSAVENVNTKIAALIVGKEIESQKELDEILINLDGTKNKSNLGANAILSVSLAFLKACAESKKLPLFKYIKEISENEEDAKLPTPMVNIFNGGQHAIGSTDIQEFMIVPNESFDFDKKIQISVDIFKSLKKVLKEKGYPTTVGDEGGFAPHLKDGNREALELISEAVKNANYSLGQDVFFALDVAASELFKDGKYFLETENKSLTTTEMIAWYEELCRDFPIISIEDGLDQEDWEGWKTLTEKLGGKIKLVGDDLFVTNKEFLQKGISEKCGNSILIKLNQIGTITETIETVNIAKENNFTPIISHRSGETEDTTIAHFAVGLSTPFIKTGSMSRTDRVAKYNELLRISEII